MKHTVTFQHSETLETSYPELNMKVQYWAISEIETNVNEVVSNTLISLIAHYNGLRERLVIPDESTEKGRRFLAVMREKAVTALLLDNEQPRERPMEQMFPKKHIPVQLDDEPFYG